MKKLFFAVSALAALSLLVPSAGFAQHEFSNQVGLYLTPDGFGETGTMTVGDEVFVFLVLTRPTDVLNGELPYEDILGFELRLYFSDPTVLFKSTTFFPTGAKVIGGDETWDDGYLEYYVVMADDFPVTEESVVLIKFGFVAFSANPVLVTLGPTITNPAVEGQMTFMAVSPDLRAMYPSSGSFDDPVFTFNVEGGAVPTENESFGSVKALFR